MATTKSLTVNFTIDKSRNKVLFAESDKGFVDVLLSFLTLPLGTIVSISNKNSTHVCLDNLYKSVEGLSNEYFKTTPCREMLLRPNYEAEFECLDLLVNAEGDTDRALIYYTCLHNCPHDLMSSHPNALCACGSQMVRKVKLIKQHRKNEIYEGVFLKGATQFIITDDLTVMPLTAQVMSDLLVHAGTNMGTLVEKQVKVSLPEIIAILRQSLISKDTLSNVFLGRENDNGLEKKNGSFALIPRPKPGSNPSYNNISIKLIVDKHENKFLFAECKQDFIDILFSFLTFTSGFVTKILNGKSHLTCLDNLFASALSKPMSDCFKTNEMKEYVVNPRLPLYFRSAELLIKSDITKPMRYYMCRTPNCDSTDVSLVPNIRCKCRKITNKRMEITDPRRSAAYRLIDQGFVSDALYVVTDDLVVTPLSNITRIIANATGGVVEIPINIGEKEVLALMEAALGSQAVFTYAFLDKEESTTNAISVVEDDDGVLV